MAKRVFLIVLDSFGVGAEPDAPQFGDAGTNTLGAIAGHPNFKGDNLAKLGMFNLAHTSSTPLFATPKSSLEQPVIPNPRTAKDVNNIFFIRVCF